MKEVKFHKSGILLVDKPVGISSNAVVNIVKHSLGAKKCGHLGTLDLEGAGLLPVTINSATKLFDLFLQKDKTYETVFEFGRETDTLDLSGKVINEKTCKITIEKVKKIAHEMIGKYDQMPPMFSAKKVGGKVAYKEAVKGNMIDLKPKEIEIYDFQVLDEIRENVFKFSISCSSGTYIRSIARDMAKKLGTYGVMQCILRTRCGGFHLKDAFKIEDIKSGNFKILPCEDLFDLCDVVLSFEETQKLLNGQILRLKKDDGQYKLFGNKNEFLGIGEVCNQSLKLNLRLL